MTASKPRGSKIEKWLVLNQYKPLFDLRTAGIFTRVIIKVIFDKWYYQEFVERNQSLIPTGYVLIFSGGKETTVSLRNPIQTVRQDLNASKYEILAMQI